MAFWSKKNEMDTYDSDGYYEATDTPVAPAASAAPQQEGSTAGLALGGNNIELKVARPERYEDAVDIADYLLAGCTVFLNLTSMERREAQSLLQFVTGVAYATRYDIRPVAEGTFIVSPANVDVSDFQQPV